MYYALCECTRGFRRPFLFLLVAPEVRACCASRQKQTASGETLYVAAPDDGRPPLVVRPNMILHANRALRDSNPQPSDPSTHGTPENDPRGNHSPHSGHTIIGISQDPELGAYRTAHGGAVVHASSPKNQVTWGFFSAEDGGFELPHVIAHPGTFEGKNQH